MIAVIFFLMFSLNLRTDSRVNNPGPGHYFTHGPVGLAPGHSVRL